LQLSLCISQAAGDEIPRKLVDSKRKEELEEKERDACSSQRAKGCSEKGRRPAAEREDRIGRRDTQPGRAQKKERKRKEENVVSSQLGNTIFSATEWLFKQKKP
jgi:hypothetical protein